METWSFAAAIAYAQAGFLLLAVLFYRRLAEARRQAALIAAEHRSETRALEAAIRELRERLTAPEAAAKPAVRKRLTAEARRKAIEMARRGAQPPTIMERLGLLAPEVRLLMRIQGLAQPGPD